MKFIMKSINKYRFYFWCERNDVSTDLEKDIEAYTKKEAIDKFQKTTLHKKIEKIEKL